MILSHTLQRTATTTVLTALVTVLGCSNDSKSGGSGTTTGNGNSATSGGGSSSTSATQTGGGSANPSSNSSTGGTAQSGTAQGGSGGSGGSGSGGSAGEAGAPGAGGTGGSSTTPQTVGDGDIDNPAEGPGPSHAYGDDTDGYVLVKNWDFGRDGTIRSIDDLSEHFQYYDQFNQISNGGGKYGAYIVAPDREHALNDSQPIEGENTDGPVREFLGSSMKTFLVGLDGAEEVHPESEKAGCGSFQARWTLPRGGSLLGQDLLWETRVRYVTPPYFWFAIWTAGNQWDGGAEMDVIESFGYDNGGEYTNYDGRYWHSSVVGGTEETNYHSSWGNGMGFYGIDEYDATEYHTWTWIYHADDSFEAYVDGIVVQRGTLNWTLGASEDGEPIDMSFIFDGAWGHTEISSVNHPLDVVEFEGKYYEWDFSRVYLRE